MNDRPSPGQFPDSGYDGLATTTFAGDSTYVSYETQGQGVNYAAYGSYDTGAYDTTAWVSQDGQGQGQSQDAYMSTIPAQAGSWGSDTGAWNTTGTDHSGYADYQPAVSFGYDTSAEQTGHWAMPGYGTETGAYDATAWNTVTEAQSQPLTETPYEYQPAQQQEYAPQEYTYETATAVADYAAYDIHIPSQETVGETYQETAVFEPVTDDAADDAAEVPTVHDLPTQAMPVTAPAPAGARAARRTAAKNGTGTGTKGSTKAGAKTSGSGSGSSRRRTPAKRSALLTVAVPSACVMGVAGVAAASVGGLAGTEKTSEDTTTMAAPDPASVKPVAANTKLDTQLAALSADAGDFADRASRTQERIDLRQRQEEEKKRKAEEAAAKEAARPKFAVPVAQHGLSANFGQSGGMWMSVHTGIDFPVGYGTPVMAATDGTVRTQYNSAYGNMAIVTAPDGTETWYCHLSSTKIRGGKVKAGEVIAYSGNSGNSTGPHLHFEVRPGGGSAIDPLAWLRSHGLNPT